MHGPQFPRCEQRLRIALVAHDVVLEPEFLEQPEHALRTRVVQVMDRDHAGAVTVSWPATLPVAPRLPSSVPRNAGPCASCPKSDSTAVTHAFLRSAPRAGAAPSRPPHRHGRTSRAP